MPFPLSKTEKAKKINYRPETRPSVRCLRHVSCIMHVEVSMRISEVKFVCVCAVSFSEIFTNDSVFRWIPFGSRLVSVCMRVQTVNSFSPIYTLLSIRIMCFYLTLVFWLQRERRTRCSPDRKIKYLFQFLFVDLFFVHCSRNRNNKWEDVLYQRSCTHSALSNKQQSTRQMRIKKSNVNVYSFGLFHFRSASSTHTHTQRTNVADCLTISTQFSRNSFRLRRRRSICSCVERNVLAPIGMNAVAPSQILPLVFTSKLNEIHF